MPASRRFSQRVFTIIQTSPQTPADAGRFSFDLKPSRLVTPVFEATCVGLQGPKAWARLTAQCAQRPIAPHAGAFEAAGPGRRRFAAGRGDQTATHCGDTQEDEVQPRKILVVDDSKLIHKMFEVLLRQFSLIHAHDGIEALQCLGNQADIDLILLDINMPRMSGLEFLNQVKADEAFREIPVVIISTEGKEEDTIRGLEAGAAAYIKKPFGNQELLEVIQKL